MLVLHPFLAKWTSFPRTFSCFIATNMDIRRGEQFDNLFQYILQKSESNFFANAEFPILVRLTRTRKFRIGCEHFFAMPRHLYFRDDGDVVHRSIFHDIFNVMLSVVASIGTWRVLLAILPDAIAPPIIPVGFSAIGGLFNQFRIFLNLNSPSSGIREM